MPPKRGTSDGAVRQLPDGRWLATLEWPSPNGQRKRTKRTFSRKGEASAWLKAQVRDRDDGRNPGERLTVAAWLADWLARQERTKKSKNTLASYRGIINRHLVPAFGAVALRELQPDHIDALFATLADAGASKSTMHRVRVTLHMAITDAVKRRKLHWDPVGVTDLPEPKETRRGAQAMTQDQAQAFVAGIAGDRLEALWLLMLHRGLRPGEVCGLRWVDLDLDAGLAHIRKARLHDPDRSWRLGDLKTPASRRSLTLDAALIDALVAHGARQAIEREAAGDRWADHGLVFTTPLGAAVDRWSLRRFFVALTRQAGITQAWDPAENAWVPHSFHPHELRHTFATLARQAGIPAWKVGGDLGHQPGSAVTQAVYLAHDDREVRGDESGAAVARLLGPSQIVPAPVPAPLADPPPPANSRNGPSPAGSSS